jgi:hypothetical protein
VLLRDQNQAPFTNLDVRLVPVGDPQGRPPRSMKSDNFGSAVFEDMLAGEYQLTVSDSGQVMIEEQSGMVQPGMHAGMRGQGHQVTVPRGVPVSMQISDVAGYGIEGVHVTATATDRVRLTVLETDSDIGGRAQFAHLSDGTWQIDVTKDGYERAHTLVRVVGGQLPEPLTFRLVRLR